MSVWSAIRAFIYGPEDPLQVHVAPGAAPKPPSDPRIADKVVLLRGDGSYDFEIVGESHYQPALARITGGKTRDGVRHECFAFLSPEPENPHDPLAVQIAINGLKVGHLDRATAKAWQEGIFRSGPSAAAARARIVGGWKNSRNNEGSFGVKLDITYPLTAIDVIDPA